MQTNVEMTRLHRNTSAARKSGFFMPEILFDNDSHLGDNRYIVWWGAFPSGDVWCSSCYVRL